jgi:hypothetical protein
MATKKTLGFDAIVEQYQKVAPWPAKEVLPDEGEDAGPRMYQMWDDSHPMVCYRLDAPLAKDVMTSGTIVAGDGGDAWMEMPELNDSLRRMTRPTSIAKPPNGPITIITLDRGEDVAIRPLVLEDAVWIVGEPLGSMKELIDYIGENDVL